MKRSIVVLIALAVAGLVMMALGARGAASSRDPTIQLPYMLSGGVGGLGVVTFALGLLSIQLRRYEEARYRDEIDTVIRAVREVR
jgi:hypothetical protein